MRPDGGPLLGAGGRPAEVSGGLPELGQIGDGHDHLQVPLLGRGWLDDLDRAAAGQETGDLLDRPDGGGEADALGGLWEQGIEALQAEREMSPTFGTGHRLDLIDDDGLHAGQGLAGRAGQQQEEGLGSGDEYIGGGAGEGPPLIRRGVTRTHRHRDLWLRQAEPGGGVRDPDQRATQIALDVDGKRLHGRDVKDSAAGLAILRRWGRGQAVERPQEGRQGLAGAGGRDDQGVLAAADGLPGALLGGRGLPETPAEPGGRRGGQAVQDVVGHIGDHPLTSHRHRARCSACSVIAAYTRPLCALRTSGS